MLVYQRVIEYHSMNPVICENALMGLLNKEWKLATKWILQTLPVDGGAANVGVRCARRGSILTRMVNSLIDIDSDSASIGLLYHLPLVIVLLKCGSIWTFPNIQSFWQIPAKSGLSCSISFWFGDDQHVPRSIQAISAKHIMLVVSWFNPMNTLISSE